MCPASAFSRRQIIRDTWSNLYQNELYDHRFVLSNYDAGWDSLVKQENETYGDIIKLDWLDPSPEVSNRIKAMELFSYLVGEGKQYAWVSKLDDDAFLSADKFYQQFLNNTHVHPNTLISMKNRGDMDYYWPGGAFYTLSWGLVEEVVRIHNDQDDFDTQEDVRVGKYLHDAKVNFDYVQLGLSEMLEIPIQGARIPHTINKDTLLVHFLKNDELYMEVASLFDSDGYTGRQLGNWTER